MKLELNIKEFAPVMVDKLEDGIFQLLEDKEYFEELMVQIATELKQRYLNEKNDNS